MKINTLIFFIILSFFSCNTSNYDICSLILNKIRNNETVYLNTIFPFKWDKLYIIDSYVYPETTENEIGITCKDCGIITDSYKRYLFIRDKKIVYNTVEECQNFRFLIKENNGIQTILFTDSFEVIKSESDMNYYVLKKRVRF